jgi:hypothetical protein
VDEHGVEHGASRAGLRAREAGAAVFYRGAARMACVEEGSG